MGTIMHVTRTPQTLMEAHAALGRIDQLKAELDALRPLAPEAEQRIRQKFRLDWNYHSNALEGNTLTRGETRIFLLYGLTAKGKPLRDHLDIKGHDEAIDYLIGVVRREETLTEVMIRGLHALLLGEPYRIEAQTPDGRMVTKEIVPGRYKLEPNHVRTVTGKVHYYALPEETPAKMQELVAWYRAGEEKGALHPLVLAALFHHRFTAIHPFDDGNGRMARILSNLILMRRGYPPLVVKKENKEAYLYALAQADEGDPGDLLDYFAEALIQSMELYTRGARGEALDELGDFDKKMALLTRQLESKTKKADTPKTIDSQVWLFDSLVEALLRKLYSKFDKVDRLFQRNHDYIFISSGGNKFVRGDDRIAKIPGLRELLSEHDASEVQVSETWTGFIKHPAKRIRFHLHVYLGLHEFSIELTAPANAVVARGQYYDVFTEEDSNALASQLLGLLFKGIERLAGS